MKRTVERYTRKEFGKLTNEIRIEDPGAYSRPFTVTFTANLMPNGEILEYICQESEQSARHLRGPAIVPSADTQPGTGLIPVVPAKTPAK